MYRMPMPDFARMMSHPALLRAVALGAWGAAAGIAFGAIVGWYLAEIQARNLDCAARLCEGNGFQVPVGMFFGFWAGILLGVVAAVTFAIWSRRRSRGSAP
jgi:ABC-type antimicrobial peptide transport system permease subunit